jgi:hypothetical protein
MKKLLLTAATLCTLGLSSAVAYAEAQVDLCHYSEEEAIWVLITISENAVPAHLRNHDDAYPGGVTPSGVTLDENCAPVAFR